MSSEQFHAHAPLLDPLRASDASGAADAGGTSDAAVVAAMVEVEVALVEAWAESVPSAAVAAERIRASVDAPGSPFASDSLACTASELARASAGSGAPVLPLVDLLRAEAPPEARRWVHRGPTTQDVVDSALMVVARTAAASIDAALAATVTELRRRAALHASDLAVARTLTQPAVPTTLGARFDAWAAMVEQARVGLLGAARLPVQLGGAGGTLASFVEISRAEGLAVEDARLAAATLPAALAERLGLETPAGPWHTSRGPVTALGDALVRCTDALGTIASDVALLGRPEIGEVIDTSGGGSSAMPHKRNPVRAVLVRAGALRAPALAMTLHTCAATAIDERPDGAWHAEWRPLQELLALTVASAVTGQALVEGLAVDPVAARAHVDSAGAALLSERIAAHLRDALAPDALARVTAALGSREEAHAAIAAETAWESDRIDELLDPHSYLGLVDPAHVRGGRP
ncbi:lyase family protein [Demequina sp. NBRC 110056]|uniref:lyase family protein n=1 Tax=Demequina sp. NBRC 110056 TaxID=1570345 RepID=UPI000A04E48C|nr:lyase family protein [Demequina sp. NBRC 110056]